MISKSSIGKLKSMLRYCLFIFALTTFFYSCRNKEVTKALIYEGPMSEHENVLMHYTENDRVKAILKAKKIFQFQNGDEEFPAGIYLEFFDKTGKMTSTLRANSAYHFKNENKWRGRGKVEIKNIDKNQQLNSEELFWFPGTRKISTDKFVTITDAEGVVYGTGLEALEDMSTYHIKNITGNRDIVD